MIKKSISEKITEFYENYYQTDLSEWRNISAQAKAKNIINISNRYPHETILEIGAGEGAVLFQLSKHKFGTSYTALEISSKAVNDITKKNIPGLMECKVFDGSSVPYENKQFDLVILSHVIEHLEFPRQLIYEAGRVGSYVFIEVPLEDTINLGKNVKNSIGHINFYSKETFKYLIESCHMQILDQRISNLPRESFIYRKGKRGNISYFIKELALKVLPNLATRIWTYHCYLVCRSCS